MIADAPSRQGTEGPISVSVTVTSLCSLAIAPSGSGILTVAGVNAPSLAVTLAGSGMLRADGQAARLEVSVSSDGDAELWGLVARDARAVMSGSGRIALTATSSLSTSMSGSGLIQYAGNPARLATSVTGTGVIVPG